MILPNSLPLRRSREAWWPWLALQLIKHLIHDKRMHPVIVAHPLSFKGCGTAADFKDSCLILLYAYLGAVTPPEWCAPRLSPPLSFQHPYYTFLRM